MLFGSNQERSFPVVMFGVILVVSSLIFCIFFITAPVVRLLGESEFRMRSAFHGVFAGAFMITATIGFYQALKLWSGIEINVKELKLGSLLNAVFCFFTIVFGNWLYIPYRSQNGPRSYFLQMAPEVHKIFFEFKEFTALFTLPLLVAASWIIWRHEKTLNTNKYLKVMSAILLVLGFFYFVISFGLGAAITKMKAV